MLEKNAEKIAVSLKESDLVLDVGGGAKPFNRANYMIDLIPYEKRGIFGSQDESVEHFSKESWIQRDLCSREPFPFKDKMFNFVICSHLLEDIRDPLWICQEIIRIGKRGYIETPSRLMESCRGVESPNYSGYWHHRWLVERLGHEIVFTAKFPLIDHSWKYHFPAGYYRALKEGKKFFYFFWDESFSYRESIFPFQPDGVPKDYESFVYKNQGRPSYRYQWQALKRSEKFFLSPRCRK